MKILLAFGVLTFALSFCNLSEKLKQLTEKPQTNNTNSSSPTNSGNNPTTSGDETAEKYSLTPEQSTILNNGKEMKWDEQGMSWTLPGSWKV